MTFSRFAALFSKECRQIVRDPSSILIAFVLPIILIIIFTYAVSLDMNHLKIAVILEDDSAPARSLAGAFLANSHFESRSAPTAAPSSAIWWQAISGES